MSNHYFPSDIRDIISRPFKSNFSIISQLLRCCSSLTQITIPSSVTEIEQNSHEPHVWPVVVHNYSRAKSAICHFFAQACIRIWLKKRD